jgi:D-alanyl-D-alanine carboxypeptidase
MEPHGMNKLSWFSALLVLTMFPGFPVVRATPPVTRFPDDLVRKLDAEVARQMQKKNLPGVVVAISVPGEGEYVAVQGKSNLETGRAREFADPFRIASITKTFTATAILQLVDQGKLRKSDTLSAWYPDFPSADKIRIADLLRMRSGIADPVDHAFMKDYYDHPLMDLGPDELIRRAKTKAARFTLPDRQTRYTELNYILLGDIVRRASGQDIAFYLRDHICTPLGMKNTVWPTTSTLPGELHGYGWNAQTKAFEDKTLLNAQLPGGAGAMISTMADLQIFARALYKGDLLKPETQKARLDCRPIDGAPAWVRYGEGIGKFGRFYGHNGAIWGFSTDMFYLPEKDATIIISVNRNDADERSHADGLFFGLTRILFPAHVDW